MFAAVSGCPLVVFACKNRLQCKQSVCVSLFAWLSLFRLFSACSIVVLGLLNFALHSRVRWISTNYVLIQSSGYTLSSYHFWIPFFGMPFLSFTVSFHWIMQTGSDSFRRLFRWIRFHHMESTGHQWPDTNLDKLLFVRYSRCLDIFYEENNRKRKL